MDSGTTNTIANFNRDRLRTQDHRVIKEAEKSRDDVAMAAGIASAVIPGGLVLKAGMQGIGLYNRSNKALRLWSKMYEKSVKAGSKPGNSRRAKTIKDRSEKVFDVGYFYKHEAGTKAAEASVYAGAGVTGVIASMISADKSLFPISETTLTRLRNKDNVAFSRAESYIKKDYGDDGELNRSVKHSDARYMSKHGLTERANRMVDGIYKSLGVL